MKIAVTGADGFLGWHLRCRIKALGEHTVVPIKRSDFATGEGLTQLLTGVDAVIHCAGVNRASDEALRDVNPELARILTAALDSARSAAALIYANSIHAGSPTPFGQGKQRAADHLAGWARGTARPFADVRLPNLFGEHGRPHYNSVIATFCHEVAEGRTPTVSDDRPLPLLHVQEAAQRLLDLCANPPSDVVDLPAEPTLISDALARIVEFREVYRTGEIPQLRDGFDLALFNTLRSHLFPASYPLRPLVHSDDRGDLFDVVRSRASEAQVFCSTTRPGFVRGQHFHLHKIERFLVVQGSATISLRRLFTDQVISFDVAGDQPAIVDMPTMWAHSIANTGGGDLMTLFWANELLDTSDSDTYPERVDLEDSP